MTKKLNVYVAIGHWKDSDNITCIADSAYTKKDFQRDLIYNDFVANVILTEDKMAELYACKSNGYDVFCKIKGICTRSRIDLVIDYIQQCWETISDKHHKAYEDMVAEMNAENPEMLSPRK